jgi:Flp pilus assembly protein TadB
MTDSLVERTEDELSWAGLALAETLRVGELALVALIALLVTPPLLILAVVVLVPSLLVAAVVGLFALPVMAVRHHHRRRSR